MITSQTFDSIKKLIEQMDVLISSHGYDELANDGIMVKEIMQSVDSAVLIEDYPDFWKGPAILLLQKGNDGNPIHTVWGIPKGEKRPAVLVTAYKPDPEKWSDDFTRRV